MSSFYKPPPCRPRPKSEHLLGRPRTETQTAGTNFSLTKLSTTLQSSGHFGLYPAGTHHWKAAVAPLPNTSIYIPEARDEMIRPVVRRSHTSWLIMPTRSPCWRKAGSCFPMRLVHEHGIATQLFAHAGTNLAEQARFRLSSRVEFLPVLNLRQRLSDYIGPSPRERAQGHAQILHTCDLGHHPEQ